MAGNCCGLVLEYRFPYKNGDLLNGGENFGKGLQISNELAPLRQMYLDLFPMWPTS